MMRTLRQGNIEIVPNLTYYEACRSYTAKRFGFCNCHYFTGEYIENARMVGNEIFLPIREHFGIPIKVNSLFRSKRLNTLIGGSNTSAHLKALAIDLDDTFLIPHGFNNSDIFRFAKENLNFDQLIWELGDDLSPDWVHIGIKKDMSKNRRMILRSAYKFGKLTYERI